MKKRIIGIIFTFSFFAYSLNVQAAQKPLVLFSNQPAETNVALLTASIYTELFNRINIPIEIKYGPSERSSFDIERGRADGQFTRVFGYQEHHPNQIRVNVPVMKTSFLAVTRKDSDISIDRGWSDLRGTKLRVGYMKGVIASKNRLTALVDPQKIDESRNIEQGLLKLQNGRIDIFVHAEYGLYPYLKSEKFNSLRYAGVMETYNMFPYMHIKHKELVPEIEKALKEIKSDGTVLRLCEDVFGRDSDVFCSMYKY